MSKRKKITKRQLRLSLFNLTLTRLKKKFKPGSIISAKELAEMFFQPVPVQQGTYEQVHMENMRMMCLQSDLNSLLRMNGLYLKSKQYYQYFVVTDKADTKRQIERMSATVDRMGAKATELEDGLKERTNRGNWGTYVKLSNESINQAVEVPTSTRHERLVKRLKRIK